MKRILVFASALLLGASALVGIYTAANTFLHPLYRSPADWYWAVFYLVAIAGVLALWALGRHRLLFRLTLASIGLFLAVVVLFSDSGPALLALAWLLVLAAALGQTLLAWLRVPVSRERPGEALLFWVGAGTIALALLTLALASARLLQPLLPVPERLTRLLHPLVVYAVLIGLSVLFIPGLWRAARPFLRPAAARLRALWRNGAPSWATVSLALLAVFGLAGALLALSPSIRFDALTYHLAVPQRYIEARGMLPLPELWNSYWAHYAEMLYTLALLVAGQPLPGLLHFTFGLLTTGLVFLFGRRLGGSRVGAAAALLFFSLPVANFEGGTAYIDFFHAFYTLSAVYAVYLWWQDRRPGWLLYAGIAAGFALGVKISAATVVLPLGLLLIAMLWLGTRSLPRTVGGLLRFGLPALALLAVWLARDFAWTGNPIFPMYNSYFNSPLWDNSARMFTVNASRWSSALSLLLLPLDLVVRTHRYYWEAQPGMLAALPLLSLPWLYAWHPALKKEIRQTALVIAALVAFSSALFLLTSPNARYMLPLFGLMAVLAALNLLALWRAFGGLLQRRGAWTILLVLIGLYFFSTRLALTVRSADMEERYPVWAALGFEPPEAFLSRSLPVYDTYQYIDRQPGQHKVLAVGSEFSYYTRASVYTTSLSRVTREMLDQYAAPEQLAGGLGENGFDFLVVDWQGVKKFGAWAHPALQEDFLGAFARLEYAQNNVYAYRLLPGDGVDAALPEEGLNLLANSGFEETAQENLPVLWEAHGSPALDSGAGAFSGGAGARVTGEDFLYQEVPVQPGELYSLGYWTRAAVPGQEARLQIMWRDNDRITVRVSAFQLEAGPEWAWQQLSATAPEGAASARVYVTAAEGSQVWVDDVVFARGEIAGPAGE